MKDNDSNKIEALTTDCVSALNKQAESEVMVWVEQGRLINDYMTKTGGTQDAALRRLADHKESVHKISQLRNIMLAVSIYDQIKDKSKIKNLALTCFIVVQNTRLTPKKREELLKRAADEEMSVSELKEAVAEMLGNKSGSTNEYSKLRNQLEKLSGKLTEFFTNDSMDKLTAKEHDEILAGIQRIVGLAVNHGLIDSNDSQKGEFNEAA